MKTVAELQDKVLKALTNKADNYYLAGGTALSLFYFKHRQSFDLDFFTQRFFRKSIENIIVKISNSLKFKIVLAGEQMAKDKAKLLVYYVYGGKGVSLKMDFVEDIYPLIKSCNNVNGISVLSIEDIYLRKIYTACGVFSAEDKSGKRIFLGGRQDAKDFFDLFFLSQTFMSLSKFVNKFCREPQKESVIIWFRTFDRLSMKTGLTEIMTDKVVDYNQMEKHFKVEVENIIRHSLSL